MVVKIKKIYGATSKSTLQYSIKYSSVKYSMLIITALTVSGNNGTEETSATKAQGMCFSSSGLS